MNFTARTSQQTRDDTNSILEKVKSNFYSSSNLDDMRFSNPDKRELCLQEIDNVVSQIKKTCRSFNLDMDYIVGLITLTVNGLVVAACTIKDVMSSGNTNHAHIEVYCTMGSETTQEYLLEEAERISLAHDLKMMTIDVPFGKMKHHMEIGFFPISVDRIWTNSRGSGSKIVNMIDEAEEEFEKKYKNAGFQPATRGPRTFSRTILNGVMGIEETSILEHHEPDWFHEWNEEILRERSNELVSFGKIAMSKRLLGENLRKYPVTYKNPSSVISSLGEATSRFMDLIHVNVYPLEANIASLKDLVELEEVVCRNSIVDGYIEDLRKTSHGENLIMAAEVSGKIIGFCILKFYDLNSAVHEPYMYIHLVCAREHAGIGGRIFAAAERFALQNGVSVVRLSALPNVVAWYQGMSFETGYDVKGNDSNRIKNETPKMDLVLPDIIKMMKKFKNGIVIRDNSPPGFVKNADTPENQIVKDRLIKFMHEMYGLEKGKDYNQQVLDFVNKYDFLMIIYANNLNQRGRGVYEIETTDGEGIHMSKNLRMMP